MKVRPIVLALACALTAVLTAVLGPAPVAAAAAPAPASLEARLKRLEDLEKINALMQRYFYVFDARDFRAYTMLFTADAELSCCGNGLFRGREAIFKVLDTTAPNLGPGAVHTGSELMIDLKGDTATARSRWTVIARGADGEPGIVERGHYDDVIVRERDGEWRFKSRRVVNEMRSSRAAAASAAAR